MSLRLAKVDEFINSSVRYLPLSVTSFIFSLGRSRPVKGVSFRKDTPAGVCSYSVQVILLGSNGIGGGNKLVNSFDSSYLSRGLLELLGCSGEG